MKGDFSRLTFDRRKHYTGVRLQQGRVQLDADWNEQDEISAYQRHTLAADVIGLSGAPEQGGGFEVTASGGVLRLSAGRYYVDGILCENESAVDLDGQPDLPGEPLWPTNSVAVTGRRYVAYLDVWQRSVTALEDPDLLEPALGGPDTATRVRTVWQVWLIERPSGAIDDGWEPETQPQPALAARTYATPQENQLYRVEVHTPGGVGEATFKWSRENGAVAARIENPAEVGGAFQIVIDRQVGPDQDAGFQPGQWIEITDERRILRREPGVLAPIASAVGQVIGVTGSLPDFSDGIVIRRWDSAGAPTVAVPADNDGYLRLDGTVEIRFGDDDDAYFRTGDYWLIPVRAASGALWPVDGTGPVPQPPQGRHHYAPLAEVERTASGWSVNSSVFLRKTFQALTLNPGQEKLDRHQDDTMTASLTIQGKLVLSTGATPDDTQHGLQFPALGGKQAYLRYALNGGAPRLTLDVDAAAAMALRQGGENRLTITSDGRLGLRTANPQKDVHLAGNEILLDASTAVTLQKKLIYKDGSEAAGRVLTSDAEGRATWQAASATRFGPVFLEHGPEVASGNGLVDWTTYPLPGTVPADASAVILQAIASMNSPDHDDPNAVTAFMLIRKDSYSEWQILLRCASASGGDSISWSGQGIFPISNHSFQYFIGWPGFNYGWKIWLLGYFP